MSRTKIQWFIEAKKDLAQMIISEDRTKFWTGILFGQRQRNSKGFKNKGIKLPGTSWTVKTRKECTHRMNNQ